MVGMVSVVGIVRHGDPPQLASEGGLTHVPTSIDSRVGGPGGTRQSCRGNRRRTQGGGSKAKSPPKELTVDLGKGVKLEMVLIPAGEFLMGSPDSDKDAFDWTRSRSTGFGSPSRSTWASIW